MCPLRRFPQNSCFRVEHRSIAERREIPTQREMELLSEQIEHRVLSALGAASRNGGSRKQHWIAIAGGPGSGKTSLAALLAERLATVHGLCVASVPMDGYHFYRHELDAMDDPAEAHARRGAAFTFNAPRLLADLRAARRSGGGSFPGFDHAVGDPTEGAVELVSEANIVIVEGLYLLLREPAPWGELSPLFDTRVFVSCAESEARRRIISRHRAAWGWGHAQAAERADANDLPNGRFVIATSDRDPRRVLCLESLRDNARFGSAADEEEEVGAKDGENGLRNGRGAMRVRRLVAAAVLAHIVMRVFSID